MDELNGGDLLESQVNAPVKTFKPTGTLETERTFGRYTVRIYRGDWSSFEITQDGKRVFAAYGHTFYIGTPADEQRKSDKTAMGKAITGSGIPDLVITECPPGKAPYIFHLFELGKSLRYVQSIDATCSNYADFENLDNDPALEFDMGDYTFAYWHAPFVSSPAPVVFLKYDGNKYVLAQDLMRKPPPSDAELMEMAKDISTMPDWGRPGGEAGGVDAIVFGFGSGWVPTQLWGDMLDLIYSGNMQAAWKLADLAWNSKTLTKQEFLKQFKTQLETSPYWPDIRKMNESQSKTTGPS